VNLNSADEAALQTLPGIGPALSQRLIDWREQHGPFGSASDLDAVPGIGPAMLAKLEGLVGYG
jgi:competence protein ComEA